MVSLNSRLRSGVLALTLLVIGQVSASWSMADVTAAMPTMPTMPLNKKQAILIIAATCYVYLYTRPSSEGNEYKLSDWEDDLRDVMASLNIFDANLYKKLGKMFKKWGLGRRQIIKDANYRTREEDGTVVTVKGKKFERSAFGAFGLFDAYVICWLDKLNTISSNFGKVHTIYQG